MVVPSGPQLVREGVIPNARVKMRRSFSRPRTFRSSNATYTPSELKQRATSARRRRIKMPVRLHADPLVMLKTKVDTFKEKQRSL